MGSFNFRSVGRTSSERETVNKDRTTPPIGIKTPLELGTSEGIFRMHYDVADVVHDNFRNMLLTNWGERLCQYTFGANLRPLASDWVSLDDFDAAATQRISTAVQRWMPYVSLKEFTSRLESTGSSDTVVVIGVTYDVPALSVIDKYIEVVFRVM